MKELLVRSLAAGERNEERLHEYVAQTQSSLKQFSSQGTLKSEESKTFDDSVVEQFHVRTLVMKNGKPLAGAEKTKEDARVARLVAQRKRETPEDRQKRLDEAKDKREKDHRFTHELLEAYDFTMVGEETVGGRQAWVLQAVPHSGYKPRDMKAQIFPHLRGRVWIDREDLLWVKAEAEGFEPFSIGFSVVAKLDSGAHVAFEQSRLPDGVWVPRTMNVKASGRVALVKHFSIESDTRFSNYRKVPSSQRILDPKEDF